MSSYINLSVAAEKNKGPKSVAGYEFLCVTAFVVPEEVSSVSCKHIFYNF